MPKCTCLPFPLYLETKIDHFFHVKDISKKGAIVLKYVRRFIWFIVIRLFFVCCILGLCVVTFYYAMNASNIHVLLKDGMAKRAQVIMMNEEESILTNYFANSYLDKDQPLQNAINGQSVYKTLYDITGFDHRINMTWMWCWPWDDISSATIEERIPAIDGKLKSSQKQTAKEYGYTSTPPKWTSARYRIILTKENGHWKINEVGMLNEITGE